MIAGVDQRAMRHDMRHRRELVGDGFHVGGGGEKIEGGFERIKIGLADEHDGLSGIILNLNAMIAQGDELDQPRQLGKRFAIRQR